MANIPFGLATHAYIYFDISAHEKSLFLFFYKYIMLNEVKNLVKTSDGNGFEPLDFTQRIDHFGGFDASGNTCSLIGKLGQTWRDVNINNTQNMEIFRPFNR